jgi:hypothetical protein
MKLTFEYVGGELRDQQSRRLFLGVYCGREAYYTSKRSHEIAARINTVN